MREPDPTSRPSVAVVGCGAWTAVGPGVSALWSAVRAHASGLCPDRRFDSPRFQSAIVGAALQDDTGSDDPAFLLATEALGEARAQAGDLLASLPAARIGLVLSTTKANVTALERLAEGRPCSDPARRHIQGDLLAADLARVHAVQGPVQCVSVACISGLVAIVQGVRMIQGGAADAVCVVGVDVLSAFVVAGFTALKAIDPEGCRPFDRDRRGLSPGEAGAAVVLVRADRAPRPAIVIRGWGGSNDANHVTGPSRDGSGLAQAIRCALETARLRPDEIDHVHAHGTGTPYNDAMEALALRTVFGEAGLSVNGSKGMLGHTLGAAGVVETIVCLRAMEEGWLPGTPGLVTPAEGAPSGLVREPRPATLNHVLKLNTGFGGANGALILGHG